MTPTNPITELLAGCEERAKKATPGPWTRKKPGLCPETGFHDGVGIAGTAGRQMIYTEKSCSSYPSADADFIAASRTDIPLLIAACRALLEAGEGLKAELYGDDPLTERPKDKRFRAAIAAWDKATGATK